MSASKRKVAERVVQGFTNKRWSLANKKITKLQGFAPLELILLARSALYQHLSEEQVEKDGGQELLYYLQKGTSAQSLQETSIFRGRVPRSSFSSNSLAPLSSLTFYIEQNPQRDVYPIYRVAVLPIDVYPPSC